jgi:hypothetical protein
MNRTATNSRKKQEMESPSIASNGRDSRKGGIGNILKRRREAETFLKQKLAEQANFGFEGRPLVQPVNFYERDADGAQPLNGIEFNK